MKKRSIVIVGMAIILVALLLIGCGGGSDNITMEQFNSIEIGMDYSEVATIFERPGELFHAAGNARVYHWENSSPYALITVIFVNDEVDSTAQVGLD